MASRAGWSIGEGLLEQCSEARLDAWVEEAVECGQVMTVYPFLGYWGSQLVVNQLQVKFQRQADVDHYRGPEAVMCRRAGLGSDGVAVVIGQPRRFGEREGVTS
ncbi:MAG: hypothetical protein F4X65_13955 [Chloroflexi bacterium]|nr:hypothetical protein [Chloroflexota bacterium]